MAERWTRRAAVGLAAWLPFFAMWLIVAMSFEQAPSRSAFIDSVISMGSAGLLGIGVSFSCRRWPWPIGFRLRFYLLQIGLAICYGVLWTFVVQVLQRPRSPHVVEPWPEGVRQVVMGMWFYAVFAGISYAVQTRSRLHEKETLAARAEALAASARLEALRARLDPHFLFNALHTLTALVRFQPSVAESAIERLGDMLRYALKEDKRGMVSFGDEFDFTRQYLAFEQLRYEDRLKFTLDVDPESYDFDLPPFCLQTLAENAVHHAIATRPDGGSIWITCRQERERLRVTVRDDGPGRGTGTESHQLGLRTVRARLRAAFGTAADLHIENENGFQASFVIPSSDGRVP